MANLETIHRAGFVWRMRREAARLRQSSSPTEHRLAGSLEASLTASPAPAEATWIQRIEVLRTRLQQSNTKVSFDDYGAETRLLPSEPASAPRRVTRTMGSVCQSSVPPHQGRLLFHLVRQFQPQQCLELGTCLGISAAYQAAALTLNGKGHLVTLEGGASLARLAALHLERLGLPGVKIVPGRFADTLPAVLHTHRSIDFAFIDGHHNPAALHAYYRLLTPFLADEAVLVFDDTVWTPGMRQAWRTLRADPALHTPVDLLTTGICTYRRTASA
jgi:predicted O-methyltransferase YrrM